MDALLCVQRHLLAYPIPRLYRETRTHVGVLVVILCSGCHLFQALFLFAGCHPVGDYGDNRNSCLGALGQGGGMRFQLN